MTNILSKARSRPCIVTGKTGLSFRCLLVFCCALALSQCATFKKSTSGEREIQRVPPHETVQPTLHRTVSPASPMVSQGIHEYKNESLDIAEWNFEQAISIDPAYGPAYYWLARVKYRQEDLHRAMELLHRAEDLFRSELRWLERIHDFRLHIRTQRAVQNLE